MFYRRVNFSKVLLNIVASAVNGSAMPRSIFWRSLTSLSKTSKKKSENSEFPKKNIAPTNNRIQTTETNR